MFDRFFDGVDGPTEEVCVTHIVVGMCLQYVERYLGGEARRTVGDGCPLGVGLPTPNAREYSDKNAARERKIEEKLKDGSLECKLFRKSCTT